MITLKLTIEDLAQTRFAISPIFELMTALRALRHPARAAMHLPWIREALPIARRLDLDGAIALTPPEGYMPDFLTPPPSSPLASFAEELDLVRATPAAQVRADVETLIAYGHGEEERLTPFLANPALGVGRVCDALAELWRRTLEPHWPRIRSLLQEDVRYRAARLTEGGPARLLGDLDERVRWRGDAIEVRIPFEEEVDLCGRGLVLLPSAFETTRPALIVGPPWQPTLIYPARGVALLWEPRAPQADDAVLKLIGGTRAQLLALLDAPRSTTELAGCLELSSGGISQHLSVLRASGLVTGDRAGRSVLYLRTPLAERLLATSGDQAMAAETERLVALCLAPEPRFAC